ncbi:hypothetical protein X731_24640 [Mesorhizobium sp. L2C054A000]|nr:hypothetical protein [Mesorhizobium sp. L2C054A000]ESZ41013.1 hypothetical protein X731_24640 [Mesorhizobium sp. L2C054A000]
MKPITHTNNEIKLFEGAIADLKIAEGAGDIAEQEFLHAELCAFADCSDNAAIRKAAAKIANRAMADVSCYRGFLEEIAHIESKTASNVAELERMRRDFAAFGRGTTNPTVRAMVSEALARRRNAA